MEDRSLLFGCEEARSSCVTHVISTRYVFDTYADGMAVMMYTCAAIAAAGQ